MPSSAAPSVAMPRSARKALVRSSIWRRQLLPETCISRALFSRRSKAPAMCIETASLASIWLAIIACATATSSSTIILSGATPSISSVRAIFSSKAVSGAKVVTSSRPVSKNAASSSCAVSTSLPKACATDSITSGAGKSSTETSALGALPNSASSSNASLSCTTFSLRDFAPPSWNSKDLISDSEELRTTAFSLPSVSFLICCSMRASSFLRSLVTSRSPAIKAASRPLDTQNNCSMTPTLAWRSSSPSISAILFRCA